MIKGIIFDFDGLMVDTEASAYDSWTEIFQEHGCELALTQWALVLGGSGAEFDPCTHLEQQLGRMLDRDALLARRWERKLELVAELPLLPGVAMYLDAAQERGLKLGVASSSSREWVIGHLQRLGVLDRFDSISCSDDVTRVKPYPDLYQTALTALGLQPEQAIVLEDSPNGLLAAKRAGIFCVAIPNPLTGQLPLDHADLRLASLADMSLSTLITTVEDRLLRG